MAIPTSTEFEEGKEDLNDAERLLTGSDTTDVTTRLGGVKPSLLKGVKPSQDLLASELQAFETGGAVTFPEMVSNVRRETLVAPICEVLRRNRLNSVVNEDVNWTRSGAKMSTVRGKLTSISSAVNPQTPSDIGWEVSPNSTNTMTHSDNFSDPIWIKNRVTVQSNVATAPDGTGSADRVRADNDGYQLHIIYRTDQSAGNYTFSAYLHPDGVDWVYLRFTSHGVLVRTWFNIADGTIGTEGAGTRPRIERMANGWFRCIIHTTELTDNDVVGIGMADGDGDTDYTGDGTDGFFIWEAQGEGINCVTPPITTGATAVTRNRDIVFIPELNTLNPSGEFTIMFEGRFDGTIYGFPRLFSSANSNAFGVFLNGTDGPWPVYAYHGSFGNVITGATVQPYEKFTFTWVGRPSGEASYFYFNGLPVGGYTFENVQGGPLMADAIGDLYIFGADDHTSQGHCSKLRIWNKALTDEQIAHLGGV